MKSALAFFVFGLSSALQPKVEGRDVSNAGKVFVQTFNPQIGNEGIPKHIFIMATDAPSCTVTITVDQPPMTNYTVLLTNAQSVTHHMNVSALIGIKLEAPCDFSVYGMNFLQFTADGWLALPVESLGTEYAVMGVPYGIEIQLTIVAVSDNTTCTSTFPNGTQRVSNLSALGVDYMAGRSDVSGTMIVCNNKVTVLTGDMLFVFPPGCGYGDHVVEQLPPKCTLGRNFALVPTKQNCTQIPNCCEIPPLRDQCAQTYRVMAVENDTYVFRNGTETNEDFTLQAGQSAFLFLSTTEFSHLVSTKPVIVGHFLNGAKYHWSDFYTNPTAHLEYPVYGDPAFTIVPQIESYKSTYRAATCLPYPFWRHFWAPFDIPSVHFMNLVIKAGTSSQLLLDGKTFLNAAEAKPIPGTPLEAFQYQFDCSKANNKSLSFKIEHAQNASFGLLIYGLGTEVSYAFPGGMNLNDDIYCKCAKSQINLTKEKAGTTPCIYPDEILKFKEPKIWTDEKCCGGGATLTHKDRILKSNETSEVVVERTWSLTDGCARTVKASQNMTCKSKGGHDGESSREHNSGGTSGGTSGSNSAEGNKVMVAGGTSTKDRNNTSGWHQIVFDNTDSSGEDNFGGRGKYGRTHFEYSTTSGEGGKSKSNEITKSGEGGESSEKTSSGEGSEPKSNENK